MIDAGYYGFRADSLWRTEGNSPPDIDFSNLTTMCRASSKHLQRDCREPHTALWIGCEQDMMRLVQEQRQLRAATRETTVPNLNFLASSI